MSHRLLIAVIALLGILTPALSSPDSLSTPSATEQDSILPEAGLTSNPELITFVQADYPPELAKLGIEGAVIADLLVSDSGTVDSVALVQGLHPLLDTAALVALKKFRYKPAMIGDTAVPVILQYAYKFSFEKIIEKIEKFENVQGKLVELGTRAPIANAYVSALFFDSTSDTTLDVPFSRYIYKIASFEGQKLLGGSILTTTDSLGNFHFTSLPACSLVIKIVAPDYEPFEDGIRVRHGEATKVTFRLRRISYGENELVVYGAAEKKEVARQTISVNEVKKIPGFGGDAVKVVQAMPGVARPFFGGGEIVVRGAGGSDTRFFLDGVRVPTLFHFGGIKSTYNSDALEAVDFYPGGFGSRYGNAVAGVVEMRGRSPKTDRLHGSVDINLFDASVLVEGPILPNISFLATARRSYISEVVGFALNKVLHAGLPFTVLPYYWDYVVRLDGSTHNNHFFTTLFSSLDKLELLVSAVRGGSSDVDKQTSTFSNETKFALWVNGWDWDVAPNIKSQLRYSLARNDTSLSAFGFFKLDGGGYSHYIRENIAYDITKSVRINAGLDFNIFPITINSAGTIGDSILRDTIHFLFGPYGGYLNAEWHIDKLTLFPGIRYDYFPELRYKGSILPEFFNYSEHSFENKGKFSAEPSLRISARYSLMQNHTIKASMGTYNEAPQPQGISIHSKFGNPDLPATKGSQYVLGHEWQITDLISADVQTYYNMQWDRPRSPTSKELSENPKLPPYLPDGKARMYGLEVLLKHDQNKRFFGWVAYSLARSERFSYAENRWAIYNRDITHNLQVIGSLRFKHDFEFGARARFVTGFPVTPIIGVDYYDATNFNYAPVYGPANSERMAPYAGLDMRIEKKWAFKNWLFTVYGEGVNMAHLLRFIIKKDGNPLYEPPETNFYINNYDYTAKHVLSDIPRFSVGLRADF